MEIVKSTSAEAVIPAIDHILTEWQDGYQQWTTILRLKFEQFTK